MRVSLNVPVLFQINFEGKTAVGIEYTGKDGVRRKVKANKEVILSSGAVGTPHLLLLSGVGPKKHLEDMGVRHAIITLGPIEKRQEFARIVRLIHE
jgi:choline dehydrogenase-like flavoprotein